MTDRRSEVIDQTIDQIYRVANEPGFAQTDSNIKLRQLVHVLRREINEDRADAPNAFAGINDEGTPRLTPFFVEYGIFTSFPDQAPQLGRFEHPSGKAALAAAVKLFHERFPGQYGYVKVGDASGDQDEEAEVAPETSEHTHSKAELFDASISILNDYNGGCDPMPFDDGERVAALVHDDAHRLGTTFDAAPFFKTADVERLVSLARCDWSGTYDADAVAQAAADWDAGVQAFFLLCGIGFEVHINADNALAFLRTHRPEVAEALEAEAV